MSDTPSPPIFVLEGHDVGIFETVEQAQNHLEPPDVSDGIYTGYDADGRRLRIETDGVATRIALDESVPPSPQHLKEELRSFLRSQGETLSDYEDLAALTEIARRRAYQPPAQLMWAALGGWIRKARRRA